MIQFVGWLIVSEIIPTIVRKPQVMSHWIPIKSHRISNTTRHDLILASIRGHTGDQGITIGIGFAVIAGSTDGHIKFLIGAERDELPSMVCLLRKVILNRHRRGRVSQSLLDLVESQDTIQGRDKQGAISIGNADRHPQAASNGEHLVSALITICIDDGIDVAYVLAAHEKGTVLPQCHSACIRDIVRLNRYGKARGQLDRVEGKRAGLDSVHDGEKNQREEYQYPNTSYRPADLLVAPVHDDFLTNRLKVHCPSFPIIGGRKRAGTQRARVKGQPSSGTS